MEQIFGKNIKEMGSTFEFVKIYRISSAAEIFKNALSTVFRAWITRRKASRDPSRGGVISAGG